MHLHTFHYLNIFWYFFLSLCSILFYLAEVCMHSFHKNKIKCWFSGQKAYWTECKTKSTKKTPDSRVTLDYSDCSMEPLKFIVWTFLLFLFVVFVSSREYQTKEQNFEFRGCLQGWVYWHAHSAPPSGSDSQHNERAHSKKESSYHIVGQICLLGDILLV